MKLLKNNKAIKLNTIDKSLIFDLIQIEIRNLKDYEIDYKNSLIKLSNKFKLSKYQNAICKKIYS